jgi:hypothetical protein
VGVPYHAADLCPSSTYRETEFYCDWIEPYKVGCGATAVKLLDNDRCFATVGANYPERLTDRVKEPIAHVLSELVPHLNRAIDMNRMLAQTKALAQSIEDILDTIARPLFC